jgi:hypothetical protein
MVAMPLKINYIPAMMFLHAAVGFRHLRRFRTECPGWVAV